MVKQATLEWTAAGGAGGVTVTHWLDTTPAADIATKLHGFASALAPQLASGTTIRLGAELKEFNTASGALVGLEPITPFTPVVGSGGPSAVPNAAQGLIRLRTNQVVNGRLLQGRIYVPGLSTATQLGNGEVNSSGIAALVAAGGVLTSELAFQVWHRPVLGAGGLSAPVVAVSAWTEFAVQRRRRS